MRHSESLLRRRISSAVPHVILYYSKLSICAKQKGEGFYMKNSLKKSIVLFAIAALFVIPLGSKALAQEQIRKEAPDGAAMVADFVILRPVGIFSIAAGSVFFALSSPFSALGGNIGTAWNKMVVSPAKFTFARPLGDF